MPPVTRSRRRTGRSIADLVVEESCDPRTLGCSANGNRPRGVRPASVLFRRDFRPWWLLTQLGCLGSTVRSEMGGGGVRNR